MKKYPETPNYTGLNTPSGVEWRQFDLDVEGDIPVEIEGSFFRAVPDPQYPPFDADEPVLSDDATVHRIQFKDGHVHTDLKFVQTARYLAERKAQKRLFGRYRNPYTDLPEAQGVDRTAANTTPIWHGGHLLLAKEDGRPYKVDPETLETVGSWDYNGKLTSLTMAAHPRIDPETGEMFFHGYEADELCSNKVAYGIADKNGNLISEQFFDAPYTSLMHDMVITKNYALFPIFPTTTDLDRVKAGGLHWLHEQDKESWLGYMPRYGNTSEMKWIKGPKGVSSFHFVNAFEDDDGKVHVDLCLYDTVFFDFVRYPSGINKHMSEIKASLTRWTIDPQNPDLGITESEIGPGGDMPRIRDVDQGRPYENVWYLCYNPELGPPMIGGPLGATVNQMMRLNLTSGTIDYLRLPPGHALNEPVHVPSKDGQDNGWLILVVDAQISDDDYRSEVWIVRADDIAAPPVAKVKFPVRLRPQVHGWWVPGK